jgi:hypothetical protein
VAEEAGEEVEVGTAGHGTMGTTGEMVGVGVEEVFWGRKRGGEKI